MAKNETSPFKSDDQVLDNASNELYFESLSSIFEKMKEEDIIKSIDEESFVEVNKEILLKLLVTPLPLKLGEEGELLILSENGEEMYRASDIISLNEEMQNSKISDIEKLLPDVPFGVTGGGNKAKAKELEAMYKTAIIAGFADGLYDDIFKNLLNNYDFSKQESTIGENFTGLLELMLGDASLSTRLVVSGCNIKLTDIKTKKELKIFGSLSPEEDSSYTNLSLKISSIKMEAEIKVRQEKDTLQKKIVRREAEKLVEEVINNSEISTIYRILKMNTESIPPKTAIRVKNHVRIDVKRKSLEKEGFFDVGRLNEITSKVVRRALREVLVELKETKLELYRKGEDIGEILSKR